MTNVITLKKGLDIKLRGAATGSATGPLVSLAPKSVAVVPDDFTGIVPRLDVKENDSVRAGQALFHDKDYPEIKVVSPVAGVVTAIERGDRRKILRIVITPDFTVSPEAVDVVKAADRVLAERMLLDSGLWAYMRQRPYGIVPRPGVVPRDIIITGFDSAPLAPDYEPMAAASIDAIDAAVALLSTLTDGSVFLTMREGSSLAGVKGCKNYVVNGPHPAGNAGVQLGNIRLDSSTDHQYFCPLVLHGIPNGIHIFISRHDGSLVHVTNVQNRFIRQQHQLLCCLLLQIV